MTGRTAPGGFPRPVERFLGPAEAVGGPFALLGLSPHLCTDEIVLAALDRQLDRVGRHPECDTPEADEVRLALHAAAAQLLDPTVRRLMAARWSGSTAAAAPLAPARHAFPRRTQAEILLEHDAILTLGLFGGWNRRSLGRLVALAHARGLASDHVAATLRQLAVARRTPRHRARSAVSPTPHGPTNQPPAPARAPRPLAPSPNTPLPEEIDPAFRLLRALLLAGGIGAMALAIAAVVVISARFDGGAIPPPAPTPAPTLTDATPAQPPPPDPAAGGTPPPRTAAAPPSAPPDAPPPAAPVAEAPAPPAEPIAPSALPREFAAAAEGLSTDAPAAAARFEHAVRSIADAWPTMPPDRLVASHNAIVEFVYRAQATPDILSRAVAALTAGAEQLARPGGPAAADVRPGIWSVGILTRLARERDLPAAPGHAIESALAKALDRAGAGLEGTFETGAAAAIHAIPRRLAVQAVESDATDPTAWDAWAQAVDAIARADEALRVRMLLAGLETLLLHGPEPDKERSTLQAIAATVARIPWRAGDESRRQLIRWFDDPAISAADLHAVTATLATRSAAEGVDITMVLSTSSSERARADMRDQYAKTWGFGAPDRDELVARWARTARTQIEPPSIGQSPVDHLARAVILSRLNEAAWWHWRGEPEEAVLITDNLDAPVQAVVRPDVAAARSRLFTRDPAGDWPVRYLHARRNIPIRLDLLSQITASSEPDPVTAEVIAAEALAGAPAEVRLAAQDVLRRLSGNATVVNAVLEFLPRMPMIATNARLVEYVGGASLPSIKDPAWPIAARRALVERLLQLVAEGGDNAAIDDLAQLLARSYAARASDTPLPADARNAPAPPPAHLSAAQERNRWLAAADGLLPGRRSAAAAARIAERRAGRLGQAAGAVQVFAAEQASLCEAMAHVVQAERPERADAVAAVLARLAEQRRRAHHIFEQLAAAEAAIAELWIIRFSEEVTP